MPINLTFSCTIQNLPTKYFINIDFQYDRWVSIDKVSSQQINIVSEEVFQNMDCFTISMKSIKKEVTISSLTTEREHNINQRSKKSKTPYSLIVAIYAHLIG